LAHDNIGRVYFQMGQHADAIASYSEAIRLRPNYARALNNRGTAQRALLHFPEAIADSTAALAIDPNYAEAFDNRGKAYNMTYRGELAREDFSRARNAYDLRLRSDPKNPALRLARANSAYDAHRWTDAVADYSSYIALNDAASPLPVAQLAHAYLFRGWARIGVYDYEAALADIETALRLQPDIKTGRLARAASLRGLGRYQDALKDDDATIDPKEPTTYLTRAMTYFCLGLYAEGEGDVQRFIEIGRNVDKDSRWLLHIFRVKRGTADDGFVDNRAPLPQTDWVTEIDSLYRGRQSIADTQKAMDAGHSGPWKNDPWPCAAKFFLGEYKLEHGDLAGARADLGAITPANCMWPEAAAAVAEMKRLPAK
jgi:tetratricopeptide (TPR) repeat protein